MADKRISQLIERTDIANNDVLPIVASGATTTNKVTISTIQNWMQDNLDVGVTSVGITLGSSGTDVNVTGSPITTSGNITINIPTASATNRGLLSSADWSTFNGKQNSITLTTSGTSGAATLVGSTLNIPNYSTGVANAYVPYVGAIGSVTLGYNSLSASQINIDGASPTGGSYLGFKHSTSVNTGTDGYTSMYTFGTNTIAFKSVSGGNSKDFSFSMVGITPNVAGGRQYTLPDASGTLALTSDLSGYVTIGTTQTITGSKTFNSKIIGQDATLTSSGSTNTLEVFHTSGSGHAVEIQKAGNGEGLRVIKTSGSGNAVTISGGLLSAEAATLTGALNGTTASFTGAITSTGTGLNPSLRLTNTTASTGTDWHLYSLNNGNLGIYNNTAGAYSLQIASTGAATFSSSVSVKGGLTIVRSNTSESSVISNEGNLIYNARDNFNHVFQSNGTEVARINTAGAATFSSSVTATQFGVPDGGRLQSNGGTQSYYAPNSGASEIGYQTTLNFRAFNGNNPVSAMFMSSSGSVGIGNASPAGQFNVNASSGADVVLSRTTGATSGVLGTIRFGNTNIDSNMSAISAEQDGATNAANLIFSTQQSGGVTTERMRISSTGNVGIGTASPSEKLHVDGGNIIVNSAQAFGFGDRSAQIVGNTGASGFLRFDTNNGERMRITSTGNVGIGTASPNRTLDIKGGAGIATVIKLEGGSSTSNTYLQLAYNGATNAQSGYIGYDGSSNMSFLTNDTERMRITSGGNVGIGTSPTSILHTSDASGATRIIVDNTANASAGAGVYMRTYSGGSMVSNATLRTDNAGNFSIFTGNSPSDTERMRITSGGFLKASNTGVYNNVNSSIHEFNSNQADNNVIFNNTSDNPYGPWFRFASTKNNSTNYFWTAEDTSAVRGKLLSNGGFQNYQANDTNLSDERTKKDIKPLESYWDKFKEIEIVKFKYKDQTHDDFNIGVIAQQVESVAPEFVDIDGWGSKPELDEEGNEIISEEEPLKSIYTADLYHASIKVLQEAMAKIEKLEAEIESLKSQING